MGLLKEDDPMHRRTIDYINKVAEAEGFTVSLEETHANQALLCAVHDACRSSEPEDLEALKNLAYELAWASRLSVQQGTFHKEPATEEELEHYHRLFNYAAPRLDIRDTEYRDAEPRELDIEYTVESDDDTVLKLKPGTQLGLFDEQS